MAKVQRALISVTDKTGIAEFAKGLSELGIELLSTGGTAKKLRTEKLKVMDVSKYTGFPELLGGRLKTLHPKIHGGILWRRDDAKDRSDVKAYNIAPIDLVVVNLYAFEKTATRIEVTFDDAIENIDIGGPAMLRAAAKNFKHVAVIVDPSDYEKVLDELRSLEGEISYDTKYYLARKVFDLTARYDMLISRYLGDHIGLPDVFPQHLNESYIKVSELRYGENPHQKAALYKEPLYKGLSLVDARILQGKEMSFNNYLDSSAAIDLVKEFKEPTAVIVKHNNPCGVASAGTIREAYKQAFKTDPVSAFGGVIALNRDVDEPTAREILELFVEIIIAPGFDPEAVDLLKQKPNIRLLVMDIGKSAKGYDTRKIQGGLLVQEKDFGMISNFMALRVVTKRRPTEDELDALAFAWKICKHMKSNAIVYTSQNRTLGIGAGQTSRVDSARLAAMKAGNYSLSLEGSAVASDAFFPNRDGIDVIAKAGATAVIQPGGSIKDKDVIAAANEHNIAMVFSAMRHFRH